MTSLLTLRRSLVPLALVLATAGLFAQAQTAKPFEPQSGQPGKDVVWVPTPQPLVDLMLNMAKVTAQDYVIDLGSGDGRTVITAAKRGATALGIEYNPDMVALSQRNATQQGVAAKATFAKADLFESDFSKATVITMFLLPSINMQLRPKILDMKPGTRIVSNAFDMEDWTPDQTENTPNCTQWCKAMLWIVPAKVGGTWRVGQNDLVLTQKFQMLGGTMAGAVIANGKVNGDEIAFDAGGARYTGKVNGESMTLNTNVQGKAATLQGTRTRRG